MQPRSDSQSQCLGTNFSKVRVIVPKTGIDLFYRAFMLSARDAHKAALANKVQTFNKGGRSSGPVHRPQPCVGTESPLKITEVTDGHPQNDLLKAVISSQKHTIQNFQLDREADRLKIQNLTAKLMKSECLVASQADYNKLREQCDLGYNAGVRFGEKKVCNTCSF